MTLLRLDMRVFSCVLLGICAALTLLKPLQYPLFVFVSSLFSGIALGIFFTVVSLVITLHVAVEEEYDESSRVKVLIVYAILEAIVFALVAFISFGHVYGIDFTSTGKSPLYAINGEISVIAMCGGLNGIWLAYRFLIDFGFSRNNGCGYAALIWVLLFGGFFAVAISTFSNAPFIAAAYFSRALLGFVASRVLISSTKLRQLMILMLSFLIFTALIMK